MRPSAVAYGVTLAAVAVAGLVRWLLDPVLGDHLPFVTFFVAVIIAAWVGGLRPALLATTLGFLFALYLFVPPRFSVLGTTGPHLVGLAMYFMVSLAIAVFGEAMWAARRRSRQAERLARQQAETLRITFASIGDAVITTDAGGNVTYLNAVAQDMTGWTQDDAGGLPLASVVNLINEQTRQPVENPVEKVLKVGQVVGLANHTVLVRKDGAERPIDDSAAPIRDDQGRVVGVVLVFHDVSERRRAEAERQEARQQIATTLESITDGFMRFDRDWRVVYANAEAERINQLSRPEMLGKTAWELFPAVVGTKLEAEYRRAVAEQVTVEFENHYEPWGRWYAIKGYPMPDGGLTTFVRDVTERKQAEAELLRSTAILRAVSDGTPDLIFVKDRDGRMLFANPATLRVIGLTEKEIIGTTEAERPTAPGEAEAIMENDRRVMASGKAEVMDEVYTGTDGTRTYQSTKSPMRDAAGAVVGVIGVIRDVTEQKRAEEVLRRGEERFRRVFEAQTVGMIEWDLDRGLITAANGHFLEMVGYAREDVAAGRLDFRAMTPPEWTARNEEGIAEIRRSGRAPAYEKEYLRKDGTRVPILIAGVRFENSDREGMSFIIDLTDRKRAEEDLRASEARFRAAVGAVSSLIWTNDAQGGMVGEQPGWGGFTGQNFQEYQGYGWSRAVHPEDAQPTIDAWKSAVAGKQTFEFEHRVRRRDGEWRACSIRAVPVPDDHGAIREWVGVHTDVTEQNLAAEQLRASEERRRLATDAAELGIWVWHIADDRGTWENDRMYEIFGTPRTDEPINVARFMSEFLHPDDAPALERAIADTLQTGARYYFEGRFRRGDGELRWIEFTGLLLRAAEGSPGQILGTAADVTDRKRAEEALRASEARGRLALDAAELGTFNIDPATNALTSDDRFRAIFGIARGPLDYEQAVAVIHPDDRTRIRDAVAAATRPDDPVPYVAEYRVVHPDGSVRWVAAKGRLNFGPGRSLPSFDGTVADVTDGKRAEEELRRLAAELSEADRRKDEFLATLAHELRNPLAPIRNGLQIMRLAKTNGEAVEQVRTMMERQIGQMVHLVDDLLDVSRISRGKLELRKERVELAAVLSNAVETSRPVIEAGGHELTVAAPPQPVFVDADATRLGQVFANLLNNAAKYSERGGRIRLTTGRQGGDVVVSVKDAGVGIAADQLPRVFEMFSQVDRSLEKSQGGLGIGLTLVKRLVEMHGGSVEARSEGHGKGSEFVVRLPVVPSTVQEVEPPRGEREPTRPSVRRRILVADDNEDSASSLAMVLEIMGNEVRTANDGSQAVDVAAAFRPDVILLDIGMPKLNGYEACRRIREQPWGRKAVVIALTGWGQDEDKRRSREAGFNHHLVKPVDPAALEKLLAGLQATTV